MFLAILCLLTIGTFLADSVNYLKFVLLLTGVFFGVVLGAYRLNAIKDGGSVLPDRTNLIIAVIGVVGYLAFVTVSTIIWGWPVAVMGLLGLFAITVYNLTRNRLIHNSFVYGICWGMIPVVLSYCFQTISWPSLASLLFGTGAAVYARFATWLWGGTTCGVWAICRNPGKSASGKGTTCHSHIISCRARLIMPREVSEHSKLLVKLNSVFILLFTLGVIAVGTIKFNLTTILIVAAIGAITGGITSATTYCLFRLAREVGEEVGGPKIELPAPTLAPPFRQSGSEAELTRLPTPGEAVNFIHSLGFPTPGDFLDFLVKYLPRK